MEQTQDYARIEAAIRYLDDHFQDQPSLNELAEVAGLSPYHFQRVFQRWAGISPKRFLQFLTVDYARGLLQRSMPVLDAAYEAGLSGPSRLHDLFIAAEAVTPGDVRRLGEDLVIRWGIHESPFGPCLIGVTERGMCWLSFGPADAADVAWVQEHLGGRWPKAALIEDQAATTPYAAKVFNGTCHNDPLALHLRGTNFQIRVWEALMRVPPAALASYEDIARRIGQPNATRAAASAVAHNPLAFVVPCHRIIRKTGPFNNYAWGAPRKQAIIGWEQARFGEESLSTAA
jgi:AraC family transcriptional regulator of adaptative response/methylated-DNA-[protein]-cysteine methyltransferase